MWKSTSCLLCYVVLGVFASKFKIDQAMDKERIVPEVIPVAPKQLLKVSYPTGARVDCGKELTPTQVKDQPSLKWNADDNSYYTLCLTNPDIPNRPERNGGEWLHWLVANVPGGDVNAGEALAQYVGSGPRPNSGLHRYVFLLYKQPSILSFGDDVARITNRTANGRADFSIKSFSELYELGTPVAGNFYLAQYDDYVPTIYKQLGVV